jgi:PRC-barrel domain protein
LHGVEDAAVQVPVLGSSAGQVRGLAVHGENGDALGRVERVLATRGGRVVALAVEVEDGLLGLGDREVVLMLDQLRREGDRLVTPLTRAQIKAQPPWRR